MSMEPRFISALTKKSVLLPTLSSTGFAALFPAGIGNPAGIRLGSFPVTVCISTVPRLSPPLEKLPISISPTSEEKLAGSIPIVGIASLRSPSSNSSSTAIEIKPSSGPAPAITKRESNSEPVVSIKTSVSSPPPKN